MKSICIMLLVLIALIFGGWYYQIYIVDSEEITRPEYRMLVERTIRFGPYKYFVYDCMRDDDIINKRELKWLNHINNIIARNDMVVTHLQEKAGYGKD